MSETPVRDTGRMRHRGGTAAAVLAVAAVLLSTPAHAAEGDTVRDRRLLDPRIIESSGLAASNLHKGVLWTHNDSGSRPRIYAVGADGRTRADYLLSGVQARDWEAMAASRDKEGKAWLWIGDIGDNSSTREKGILVHRVAEPSRLSSGSLRATSYRLVYPDAPRDAEALLIHPRTGRLYVVSKGVFGGTVYRAPARLREDGPNELESVGPAPAVVTDGVYLADGRAVLLGYADLTVQTSLEDRGQSRTVPVDDPHGGGSLPQSESVAEGPGNTVLVGTEGSRSPILRIALPAKPPTPPGKSRQVQQVVEGAVDNARSLPRGMVAVAALVGGVLMAAAVRRRRRRRAL